MPTTFQSHARLPFDDRLHRWTLCRKRMDPTFDVVIDQRDASIRFNQKEDKFVTNSKEACSIIASTSFVSFAKGTRSLVTEAPIIFFEEEEVNEYWILAFFLSNHVSIRKNKYESRKIRCYPLLFPAFPSRPALCFSSRILSSSFVLIPLRESFLFQLPWFDYSRAVARSNWREKFLPFLPFVTRRASSTSSFSTSVSLNLAKQRAERDVRRCSMNISLTVRERERERFENKRNLRVRMSRVKRFSGTSQNFRVTCFPVPLSRIARFEYTEEETAKQQELKGGGRERQKFEKKKEMEKKSNDRYTTLHVSLHAMLLVVARLLQKKEEN